MHAFPLDSWALFVLGTHPMLLFFTVTAVEQVEPQADTELQLLVFRAGSLLLHSTQRKKGIGYD